MSATVVYEIACYTGRKADPVLQTRLQVIAEDGTFRLRDAAGKELPCKETDIASALRSTPALRKVPKHQQARIICGDDILGHLPAVLEAIPDGASLFVNDKEWDAFPSVDGGEVMLPGRCDYENLPEMNPCWAEYRCAEGGRDFHSQLVGFSSIGLLAPGIAIEHGRTDYGGNGGVSGVSVTPFEDFAGIFVDWLLHTRILSDFWQGYRYITTPDVDLFAEAAAAKDHQGYWEDDDSAGDEDDGDEEEDNADSYEDDEGSFASRSLELHLPQELIEEVRARLSAR